MKTKTITALLCFLIGAIAATGVASAQSLAELARKEKDRRQNISSKSKVITNHDTAKYKNGALSTASPPPRASGQNDDATPVSMGNDESADKPAQDEPVDFSGRTESFWRQTMTDARQRVKELENESTALTLSLNDLQNRFYNEADGFRQQQIQREIQKSFYEQDLNKNDLKTAQDQLNDLIKEARKSGALPGWIQ